MDNLTHSLMGFVLANAMGGRRFAQRLKQKQADFTPNSQTKAALWTAVIGSNLPDLDFTLAFLHAGGRLGYLLEHRGLTHTLLFSLPIGWIAALLGALLGGEHWLPSVRLWLLGLTSVLLHIAADYCNNYGVHPFSPLFNQWYYGDFIFIIEPLILFVLLPYGYFASNSLFWKAVSVVSGILLLGVVFSGTFLPWTVAGFLVLWLLVFTWLHKRYRNQYWNWAVAAVGILVVYFSFWGSLQLVKGRTKSIYQIVRPDFRIHDQVLTPAPSNPFCWSVLTLGTENKKDYLAVAGFYSLNPSLFPPETCYLKTGRNRFDSWVMKENAASHSSHRENSDFLNHNKAYNEAGEFRRPLKAFFELAQNNCIFKTFLEFSRVPIWYPSEPTSEPTPQPSSPALSLADSSLVADDLRYTRFGQDGFSEIDLNLKKGCPSGTRAWTPPTQGLE